MTSNDPREVGVGIVESDIPWATGPATSATHGQLEDYPELTPVLSLAVDAVVYTFDLDEEVDPDLVAHLERVATAATLDAYAPIVATAAKVGRAAERARAARVAAVAQAAEVMAVRVAEVAAALQAHGDASATRSASSASKAAKLVAGSVVPGNETAAASAAAQIRQAVHDAAATKAAERARAAATVARAAMLAAAEVAASAEVEAVPIELEVFNAAAAIQTIALDTCYQVALNAAAAAAEKALND